MESNDKTSNEFRFLIEEELKALSEEERNQYKGRYIQHLKELNEKVLARNNKSRREYEYTDIRSLAKEFLSQEDIDALLGPSSDEQK